MIVTSVAADLQIDIGTTKNEVVAVTAANPVDTSVAPQPVASSCAADEVVAGTTPNDVVARFSVHTDVRPCLTEHPVVAVTASNAQVTVGAAANVACTAIAADLIGSRVSVDPVTMRFRHAFHCPGPDRRRPIAGRHQR